MLAQRLQEAVQASLALDAKRVVLEVGAHSVLGRNRGHYVALVSRPEHLHIEGDNFALAFCKAPTYTILLHTKGKRRSSGTLQGSKTLSHGQKKNPNSLLHP